LNAPPAFTAIVPAVRRIYQAQPGIDPLLSDPILVPKPRFHTSRINPERLFEKLPGYRPGILGIAPRSFAPDRSYDPLWKPVYEKDRHTNQRHQADGYEVDANTGMAYVLPAWRIRELLNERELINERRREDERIAREESD